MTLIDLCGEDLRLLIECSPSGMHSPEEARDIAAAQDRLRALLSQDRPSRGEERTCPNGYTLAHHIDGVLAIARTSEMTPTECVVVEHRLRQFVKFFAEPEQLAGEGEDCEFCNGDGIIRGEAPGGKVVEVAYCPNQCKSSSTEGERETDPDFDERVRERFPHLAESWDRLWAYVDHRAFGPDDAGEARSLEWHTTALRLNKLRQRICGLALSAQPQDGPPDNG